MTGTQCNRGQSHERSNSDRRYGKEKSSGTYISKENLCLASKSASVRSRSILAFVRDTVKRIPVSML